jgi:hypothetical protein
MALLRLSLGGQTVVAGANQNPTWRICFSVASRRYCETYRRAICVHACARFGVPAHDRCSISRATWRRRDSRHAPRRAAPKLQRAWGDGTGVASTRCFMTLTCLSIPCSGLVRRRRPHSDLGRECRSSSARRVRGCGAGLCEAAHTWAKNAEGPREQLGGLFPESRNSAVQRRSHNRARGQAIYRRNAAMPCMVKAMRFSSIGSACDDTLAITSSFARSTKRY